MVKFMICLLILSFVLFPIHQAKAGHLCRDGSYSQSNGRGTCSWHGGERWRLVLESNDERLSERFWQIARLIV